MPINAPVELRATVLLGYSLGEGIGIIGLVIGWHQGSVDLIAVSTILLLILAWPVWCIMRPDPATRARDWFRKHPDAVRYGDYINLQRRADAHQMLMQDLLGEKKAKELSKEMEKWDKKI